MSAASAPSSRTAAVLRAGSALLGAMWIAAALTKLLGPWPPYEFTVRLAGTAGAAKPVLVAWIAVEAGLGVAMLLGALRGFVPTLALLAAASAALLVVRSRFDGRVSCGCLGLVPGDSIDGALVRNGVLVAVGSALLALDRVTSRRGRAAPLPDPGAAAASGPATP